MVAFVGSMTFFLLGGALSESLARSTRHSRRAAATAKSAKRPPSPLPTPDFESALLVDAETGQVLFSQNDRKQWPAASLTKMMVGLLALEALDRGLLSLQTPVTISRRASQAGGRAINLRPGEVFPLKDLLQAMLVTSANDASVAVAERLKGSVEACVLAMNQRAQELGMHSTLYQTANGLPLHNGTPPDISSAADMAALARALIKYPQVLQWTGMNRTPFRAGRIMLPNTNRLVGKVAGVDGLKTGFTYKARFNLVTTAQRGPLRLIAVVMGGRSSEIRFQTAAHLLEWGFAHFTYLHLVKGGEPLEAEVRVEQGSVSTLNPVAATDATFLVRKGEATDLQVFFQIPSVVLAPVSRHQVLGEVVVRKSQRTVAIIPALSPWEVPKAHWLPARR